MTVHIHIQPSSIEYANTQETWQRKPEKSFARNAKVPGKGSSEFLWHWLYRIRGTSRLYIDIEQTYTHSYIHAHTYIKSIQRRMSLEHIMVETEYGMASEDDTWSSRRLRSVLH